MSNYLLGICLFFVFFPFVSVYPIETDVQPFSFLLILMAILAAPFFFAKALNVRNIVLVIFGVIFLIYFNINSNFETTKRFAFIAGVLIFIFHRQVYLKLPVEFYYVVGVSHILGLISQLYLYDFTNIIIEAIVRNSTYIPGDVRGPNGFNSEPGAAVAVLSGVYFSYVYKMIIENSLTFKKSIIFVSILMVGMLVTKSGLAGVIVPVALLHYLSVVGIRPFYKIMVSIIFIFAIVMIYFNYHLFSSMRIGQIIYSIRIDGWGVLFNDGSIAERLLGLSYGLIGVSLQPFGVGGGGYSIVANLVESEYNLSFIFHSARSQLDITVSSIGIYLAEFGLIFIFFMGYIIYLLKPFQFDRLILFFVILLYLAFSFSISFPITWVLISIGSILSNRKISG